MVELASSKNEDQGAQTHQNSAQNLKLAALSKHIRLTVYSYLDYGSTLTRISCLSKAERLALRDSAIAREGKSAKFILNTLLAK